MCGIAGFVDFQNRQAFQIKNQLTEAIHALALRGPDFQSTQIIDEKVAFAHARLSIIDTSIASNQPLQIDEGDFTIIFNGEIYNFLEIRTKLENEFQEIFTTSGDTEVILRAFKHYGTACVELFNGFFAFAIYNKREEEVFIARDRMGIKPLLYSNSEKGFFFASEMKALIALGIEKKIDFISLQQYFQFNYIPSPHSIFESVKKLQPGHTLLIKKDGKIEEKCYYSIPYTKDYATISYDAAQTEFRNLIELSVRRRMVADVPLGSFLSGGIDSSIIATLAARETPNLNTFSIGFKDEPYFDETYYANLVAKKIKSNHTVFSLTNNDLFENLHSILDYIDEPFADSSAIPVYILSKKTKEIVKVALSGDGADEIFGGYNKHKAEYQVMQNNLVNSLVAFGKPLWKILPKSRHTKIGNTIRQLDRFAEGLSLSQQERYWRWCSFSPESYAPALLKTPLSVNGLEFNNRKNEILKHFSLAKDLNDTLYTDMNLVLVNDMLVKVDLMSMANGLEVRVPFLDHELVNFAFQLPSKYKVNQNGRKTLIKDAFRNDLPKELYSRNKMGFEVPLLQWFRTSLKSLILDDLLSDKFISDQNIFQLEAINNLKKQLFSNNPGEVHAQIWALIVFQTWYKKYMK
jgi:asparagine synthase (glutamine-hydrolysing)